VALDRFKLFRGRRTVSKNFDGDTLDGTGEALRRSFEPADEGDARMMDLIHQLRGIKSRPDASEGEAE